MKWFQALVLCLAVAAPASGTVEKMPKLHRIDSTEPLVVSTQDPSARVIVKNKSLKPLTLELKIFDLSQPKGNLPATTLFLKPTQLKLATGDSGSFEIKPVEGATLAPGHYLISASEAGKVVQWMKLHLTAEVPAAPLEPQALAETWIVHKRRLFPFSPLLFSWRETYLPVKSGTFAPEESKLLGYLTSNSDIVAVHGKLAETPTTSQRDFDKILLTIQDPSSLNPSFAGKLGLRASEETEVNLTVKIKDFILWPIFALLAGVAMTIGVENWLQVRRPLLEARKRKAQVGVDFVAADTDFLANAENTGWQGMGLSAAVGEEKSEIKEALDAIGKRGYFSLAGNPELAAAKERLDSLAVLIDGWPAFGTQLSALQTRLAEAQAAIPGSRPATVNRTEPASHSTAATLLEPRQLSLDEFRRAPAQVASASVALDQWQRAGAWIAALTESVERLSTLQLSDEDEAVLQLSQRELLGHEARTWRAESEEDFTLLLQDLEATQKELDKLGDYLRGKADLNAPFASSVHVQTFPFPETTFPAPPDVSAGESHQAQRDYYAGLLQRQGSFVMLIVLAVTLFLGLKELYFDQDFSTPRHYFNALAWGASTKLALDTVMAGIGHLPSLARFFGGGAAAGGTAD